MSQRYRYISILSGSITAQPILDGSASCAGDKRNPREHIRIHVESGFFILGPELITLKCPKISFWGMNPSHDIKEMIACDFFRILFWKVPVWQVKGSAFRLPGWTVLCRIIGIFVHTRILIQWRKYAGISTDRTSSSIDCYSVTVILYVLHK